MMQMVELASDTFVCIVDESKLVDGLGGSKGASWNCLIPSMCPQALAWLTYNLNLVLSWRYSSKL